MNKNKNKIQLFVISCGITILIASTLSYALDPVFNILNLPKTLKSNALSVLSDKQKIDLGCNKINDILVQDYGTLANKATQMTALKKLTALNQKYIDQLNDILNLISFEVDKQPATFPTQKMNTLMIGKYQSTITAYSNELKKVNSEFVNLRAPIFKYLVNKKVNEYRDQAEQMMKYYTKSYDSTLAKINASSSLVKTGGLSVPTVNRETVAFILLKQSGDFMKQSVFFKYLELEFDVSPRQFGDVTSVSLKDNNCVFTLKTTTTDETIKVPLIIAPVCKAVLGTVKFQLVNNNCVKI
jgi:hypothetical protein